MIISVIAAMDESRGIGKQGRLPWRLPSDLRRFNRLTMGHHLIMGRKTFESIGKPLAGRIMIVVTHRHDYQADGVIITHSLREALAYAETQGEAEVFVIGGGELYHRVLPMANRLYLTLVHTISDVDTYFPELGDNWQVVYAEEFMLDEVNDFATTFRILQRT